MKIREYEEEDFDSVARIYIKSFGEYPWNEYCIESRVRNLLESALSKKEPIAIVAEEKGNVIGFSWGYKTPKGKSFLPYADNSSYLAEIAVDNKFRGREIGTSLCRNYLKIADSRNMSSVSLKTDKRSVSAISLFRSLGFSPVLDDIGNTVCEPCYPERIYMSRNLWGPI